LDYDVIIAGGSFAGLAAAAQLRGKQVLLIEPNPIGTVQTSACATLLAVLEATRTMESLLQVHNHIVLHLHRRTLEFSLPDPFCTFDFRTFCRCLLAQCDVEILPASVLRHRGHVVYTTRGVFDAGVLIDATGWRAALATNAKQGKQSLCGKSFGLETNIPIPESGLHFWYDPKHLWPRMVIWMFPVGLSSRVGVASYLGKTRLKKRLEEWLVTEFGQVPKEFHGGYFPYRRSPATTGNVFRVGDAAGQCLPLTGEGIRPALYFGSAVGGLARAVTEGHLTEAKALDIYRHYVKAHSHLHHYLLLVQKFLTNIPVTCVEGLALIIHRNDLFPRFMRLYRFMLDLDRITNFDFQDGKITITKSEEVHV
jgi:flavin-dependent dehydrogenase